MGVGRIFIDKSQLEKDWLLLEAALFVRPWAIVQVVHVFYLIEYDDPGFKPYVMMRKIYIYSREVSDLEPNQRQPK